MDSISILAALRKEMTCEICNGLFIDPHLFSGCGHTFCYKCIIGKIEGKGISTSQCPTCNQPGWKRDLKPVHVLANIAEPISHLLDAEGIQASTGRTEGGQLESPGVSKQKGSATALPNAAKQTRGRQRSVAGPKRVTFADHQGEAAGLAPPACSKASRDAIAGHSHSRATRRRRAATAADALAVLYKPSLVPDTCAELQGSQHTQAEVAERAGKRHKARQSSKRTEDRCFIKQFAAEAGALLGCASSSQCQAAHPRPQDGSISPRAQTLDSHTSGPSTALPEEPAVVKPVSGCSPARQEKPSSGGVRADETEAPTASPDHSTAPSGGQPQQDAIPETPGATRRLARSSSPVHSLAQQDQVAEQLEQAAGCPGEAGPHSLAEGSAERALSVLSQGHDGAEAPSVAARTKHTLGTQTPEQAPAGFLSLVQGTGQMAAQAPLLSVEEVDALGTELCSKAAEYLPTSREDADALRAAVRSMRSILEQYACQGPGLATGLPACEPSQDPRGQSQGCCSSPRQADASQMRLAGRLPMTADVLGTAASLSAIDAALVAMGVRLHRLASLS